MTVAATGWERGERPVVPRRRGLSLGRSYLALLSLLLLGYALAGKGIAYLGVGPLYVGEIALALGLGAALVSRAALRVPRSPTLLLLLAFLAWGAARTLLCLPEYGIDALRDAVIWAYGLFALLVAGIVASRPGLLRRLLRSYARFARIFLIAGPVVWLLFSLHGEALPRVFESDVPVIHAKSGDILVHLAGIASYHLTGLGPASVGSVVLLSIGAALTMVRTRGGMLAFLLALATIAVARPRARRLWLGTAGACLAILAILSADLGISVDGREWSARQLLENATSIAGVGRSADLAGTRSWRLDWWSEIVGYTAFGPYFWWGKGFGPNLATSDGFDVDPNRSLRSPHNGHLTILARAGVPGFLLWVLTQISWLREMTRHYRSSRTSGQELWSKLFLFLCAYWVAFVTNAAFDVYLEGPVGGIWFWTLFGVGLAAARIHTRWPELLDGPPPVWATPEGTATGPDGGQ